ncbi:MAG: tRNA epoxyqueuosine(34) reductase QueG [Pseudomonadota bacterium]
MSATDGHKLKARLFKDAKGEGFDAVGVVQPDANPHLPGKLSAFLKEGHHGTMGWLEDRADWRANPKKLWPDVRSIVILAMNYGPAHDPLAVLERPDRAAISVYAGNRDYHDVIKGKLKQIAGRFAAATGADVKVFVDTAPVMEKPLAEKAGFGWQGKHTNLVSREFGSWTFLGAIFTTADLPPDAAEIDHCGTCRACLDVCPTDAFPAPYQLDARRCISYLTIEHKGVVDAELRPLMGNRIYGCDDCLAVCPWNKFASEASEMKLQGREDLREPFLADLVALDDKAFRKVFSGSPIKRIGRDKFVSNVLIAIGNSGDAGLFDSAVARLVDDAPIVRAMAVWACARLANIDRFAELRSQYQEQETDETVLAEWDSDSYIQSGVM